MNNYRKFCTNICTLHSEDVQTIIGDLSCELEEQKKILGLWRAQHQYAVEFWHVLQDQFSRMGRLPSKDSLLSVEVQFSSVSTGH